MKTCPDPTKSSLEMCKVIYFVIVIGRVQGRTKNLKKHKNMVEDFTAP